VGETRVRSEARWLRAAVALTLLGVAAASTGSSQASQAAARTSMAELEHAAGVIASHIAGRPVSVACNTRSEWAKVTAAHGGNPKLDSGLVMTEWDPGTGRLVTLASVAELSPTVCSALATFASAETKPTTCRSHTADVPARSSLAGRKAQPGAPRHRAVVPCYLGNDRTAAIRPPSFWDTYTRYALALLTLAHESVHLSGVVGGVLPNGLAVGDPRAEAKADCFGMQWIGYLARSLGDTPADAESLGRYVWERIYPASAAAHPRYWSADCRPGGAFDRRPTGAAAWP